MTDATCRLVNVFGEVALEETQLDQAEVMRELLIQIKMLNIHLAKLSDEKILIEDVLNGEYE